MALTNTQHIGGRAYRVIAIARHSETLEEMAVCEMFALDGDNRIRLFPVARLPERPAVDGFTPPLAEALSETGRAIAGRRYRHYKGKDYRALALGKDDRTGEMLMVYECLYDNPTARIWARPLAMFEGTIERDGEEVLRFAPVDE